MMLDINIRQEQAADAERIATLVRQAYQDVPYSNHREQFMIERLRGADDFLPELSLIAEVDGAAMGHILLTKVVVRSELSCKVALALAPLSVVPSYRHMGVGSALVQEAHRRAAQLGFQLVILLGIPSYYEKLGYQPLSRYPITVPFDVPERNCMALALVPNGLIGVSGVVEYPPEWMSS